ncbi:PIG-P-domain-containing protein [Trametes maxima]|nr:PIG-P-domain-containing protein [Trametes maxima]
MTDAAFLRYRAQDESMHTPQPALSDSAADTIMDSQESQQTAGVPVAEDVRTSQPEDEPTSPVSPLAPYPPILPTETRSRAPEFYGFVAWASTYLLFVLYLLWAFLPDDYITALGVSWYPNREWSLLIPAYGMVLVLLTYFTYFALALAGTPAFADVATITDSKAHLPGPARAAGTVTGASAFAPYLAHARPDAVPEMYDIPLGLVNRVVYGPRPTRPLAREGGARPGEGEPMSPASSWSTDRGER